MHIRRHPEEQVGYIGVLDSKTFQNFGQQQMSKPGDRAKLNTREFTDMRPEEVISKKNATLGVGTLHGIKSKFQYLSLIHI